ncbi:M15 family metallopeptidase [Lysobacter psychrotolerans]|uniref:M15 family metallopeptidase n=1 Tax=Montanilutibacter psychrotolerans TaxID=1327343 RepID=UPI00168154B4
MTAQQATIERNDSRAVGSADNAESVGLVDAQSLAPGLQLDIRYAGSDNFVGAPIDGYHAPRCLLLRPAAQALARVERDLRTQGLRLRVFDCYRPMRAVRHFVRWAADLEDQASKPIYYPRLDKRELLGDYIAPTSGHSRGATVDLTLERCDGATCAPLDMGTPFDFFDSRANTDAADVTALQRGNRDRLRAAMQREGFRNYPLEWWHYTLQPEPSPGRYYDVPVR